MKKQLAKFARLCLGRRSLIRGGRFLINAGMIRDANDSRTNGEFALLSKIVRRLNHQPIVFDIGANLGIYSSFASQLLKGNGRIYAAEPCSETLAALRQNTIDLPTPITFLQLAFSDAIGETELFVVGAGAGTNSLESEVTAAERTEIVQRTTLDDFLYRESISEVDFVKVDTEGHDFAVIRGASQSLSDGKIRALQFEYNWRWIGQRAFLKDVFGFIVGKEYVLGRVTPRGVEVYDNWEPNIETLTEDNFVLIRRDIAADASTYCFRIP